MFIVQFHPVWRLQRGDTLLEVLITMVIAAFGLLGFATLESKIAVSEMEAFQRSQALTLLEKMSENIRSNSTNAHNYVTAEPVGFDPDQKELEDCSTKAMGKEKDLCEWSNALKGASEVDAANNRVGAMIGARGCITQVQAPDARPGVCRAGVYQVTVVWQGINKTVAPESTCGQDLYGDETLRRAVSARVVAVLPGCS